MTWFLAAAAMLGSGLMALGLRGRRWDLRKPLYENDRSLTQISDRIGTYTIHARVRKDFLSTQHPLLSNKFTISVEK